MPQSKPFQPLNDEFNALMAKCFSPGDLAAMHPDQRKECRRFFFAGARALNKVIEAGLSPGGDISASEVALTLAIETELNQFIRDVEEGRA